MTKKQASSRAGVLKSEMTDSQQGTQFTNAENPSMSVTLASTAPKNQNSQATPNSLVNPRAVHAKIISAFAEKLGTLVEWRRLELGDGRTGYVLFFDDTNWLVDPVSRELTPIK